MHEIERTVALVRRASPEYTLAYVWGLIRSFEAAREIHAVLDECDWDFPYPPHFTPQFINWRSQIGWL